MALKDLVADIKTDDKELQSTTRAGTAPRYRIKTAEAANEIYKTLLESYAEVSAGRAKIQGMYDGNAPYNPEDLRRRGQSHRCNVNFREMEAIIDANTSSAWALFADVPALIDIEFPATRFGEINSVDAAHWASIIAEEYTRTLLAWNGFYTNLNLQLHEYFMFGLGFCMWPDEWDWRSKSFRSGALLVPPLTKVNVDEIDLVYVRDQLELGDLYRRIEDREAAEKAGWNVAAVKELLVRTYLTGEASSAESDEAQITPWESLQQKIKVGDPSVQSKEFTGIEVVHILVKELSGDKKVTHLMIADSELVEDKFLYEKRGRFGQMQDALWVIPYTYGDSYLRSTKGLGHRSFPHCEFSNRFLGRIFDGGMLSSTLLLQMGTGLDSAKLGLLRIGGDTTVIPSGVTVVQQSFAPQITQLIGLRGLSKEILHNNTGVYRPYSELGPSDSETPKTAQQVRSEDAREAKFEKNQVEHFYTQWQLWHKQTFKRLTNKEYLNSQLDLPGQKEAKGFVERCEKRGVPRKLLLDNEAVEVKVVRALGMGSPAVKMDVSRQLLGVSGSMDEAGRRIAYREFVATLVGYSHVDKYFPLESRDTAQSNAMSFATLENNDMTEGQQVIAGLDQPHTIHLGTHFAWLQAMIQSVMQNQMDPLQGVRIISSGIEHCGVHANMMAQDTFRAVEAKRAMDVLKQFIAAFDSIKKKTKEQIDQAVSQQKAAEAAAAEQAAVPSEVQIGLHKIDVEAELEARKQDAVNKRREEAKDQQFLIAQTKASAGIALAADEAKARLEMKARELEADIAIKLQKAAQGAAGK